jgi:hypothetical protein
VVYLRALVKEEFLPLSDIGRAPPSTRSIDIGNPETVVRDAAGEKTRAIERVETATVQLRCSGAC